MSPSMSREQAGDEAPRIFPVPTERLAGMPVMPVPRTSFVGRAREVERVQALLDRGDVRLVTLTGPGGVGKTRTAIRAASSAPRRAWFVDLAEVDDPALVPPTIAAALGVRSEGRPVLEALASALRDRDHLLVLDNFEQLLPAAGTLAELLDACPDVRLLVTSRALLGIPGEHVIDIRPFPLPPAGDPGAAADAVDWDACRLFVDRARALDPDFAVTPASAPAIVEICRRLDGLALAIELAAAWTSVLSPGALLAQLDDCLALPGAGSPGVPGRHRSLRDTLAWSHGLLAPAEQVLFRRIAVFTGGCSLEAVTAICGDGSLEVLPALRSLVANSLVRRIDDPTGESRYTMLETLREFGIERLERSGEAETIRRRHAAHVLALARRADAMSVTIEREAWLDRIGADLGNIHAALGWALDQGDAETALGLCGAMLPFWQFRFHSAVGRAWTARALALGRNVPAPVLRRAIHTAGTLAYMHGEHAEAAAWFADALPRCDEAGDHELGGRVEIALGRLAWDADDLDAASGWFEAARRRSAASGDGVGMAHSLHGIGLVASTAGDHPQAEAFLRDSLRRWQALGFGWELARCIPGHLGDVARAAGDMAQATVRYQECLRLNRDARDLENVSWSLGGLALVAAAGGEAERAARLMALADRYEDLTGAPLTSHIRRDHDHAERLLLERLGPERYAALHADARSADLAAEVDAALALTWSAPSPDDAPTETPAGPSALAGHGLTARELDVLRMLASGKSNREIADSLFLSPGTVKVHVTHILAKLGVTSRSAAAAYAHRSGLD